MQETSIDFSAVKLNSEQESAKIRRNTLQMNRNDQLATQRVQIYATRHKSPASL